MLKLVIEDDEGNKTVVPVIRDEITIGREEGNTIRLTERNVSRRHARLVRDDDGVLVEELSARYGTKMNGDKIQEKTRFSIGDVVLIGDYRLTLEGEGAEAEAPKTNGAAPPPEPKKSGFANAPTQITKREDIEKRASQGTEILPAQPAKLVVVSSNFAGQEFPLNRKEVVIGRADECDIIVDHRSVSQTHAKVVREQNGVYKIVDLNSKNGVKVSGEEYRAVHLKRGDVVELGHVKFRFVEPGENYVFTPQAIDDSEFDAALPGSKNNMVVIGGAAVVGLIVIVAIIIAMSSGDDPETKDPVVTPPTNNVAVNDPATNNEKPADDKVALMIEKAQKQFDEGKVERAIADLTTARDVLSPTPDEREEIDALLSQARRERPLAKDLENGRDHFKENRFVEALRKFKRIPPDPPSKIHSIMMAEELPQKSIERIMKQAAAAKEEGETDEAKRLVTEVLLYDTENAEALAMKTELDTVAEVKKDPPKSSNDKPRKKKKGLTPEEIEQRTNDGQAALISGDWKKAISMCKPIRNGKCYRIMGVAYKKLGDQDKSCKFLKRAGMNPPDCQ